jgi:hypothetical protein
MKLIDKISRFINFKNKGRILVKSRFGLSTLKACAGYLTDLASSNVDGGDGCPAIGFRRRDNMNKIYKQAIEKEESSSTFIEEIEEIYVRNNEDAKDLIVNINGIVTIDFGTVNEQYEAIRISYDSLVLDLSILIKIYSFTSGDKAIFAKDTNQKNKFKDILNSMNVFIDIIDFVDFN